MAGGWEERVVTSGHVAPVWPPVLYRMPPDVWEKNLKAVKESAMQTSVGEAFLGKGVARAKTLRQECVWGYVAALARLPLWPTWRGREMVVSTVTPAMVRPLQLGRGETRGILSSSCWLRVGCPGQRWIRKASWRCWWPRQGGGGRNKEEQWWDSGRPEVEPTGLSDAGDVERGRNRSIPDDMDPQPEDSVALR